MERKEEAVGSVLGSEGRIAQAWVNVRGGTRILQHTSGTRRDRPQENEAALEAALKRARVTKRPWLVACDANMSPVDVEKSLCFRKDQTHVVAPEKASTCRSKRPKGRLG